MQTTRSTRSWSDGEVIFEAGDLGTESYQILKGQVTVLIGYGPVSLRKEACKLDVGSNFGSLALQSVSRVRTATCIATGQTVLQIVDRRPTNIAVPSLTSMLAKEQRPPGPAKKSIEKNYKKGEFIVKQGEAAHNTYYVLVRGCLDVRVDSHTVGTMTVAGTVFGESCAALSEDNMRTASVAVKSTSGATILCMTYDAKNPGLRSMLHRRRKEILKKNHLREFNCQTERRFKSSSSMLLNLRSSIATARPLTLKSNKTNDASSPRPTRWNFLRKEFSKSGKQGAKEESLRHVEQQTSKWNVLRRMVVQPGTSYSRLVHCCTSRNDLTDTAKTNLLDQEAAESGKEVLAKRDRKNQEDKKERQRKERDDKNMKEEQEEKEKETINHQGSENQMNIVRLDLPAVVKPRPDAVHEQVNTDEGRLIVDAEGQERMWKEIIQRKAMGEKNVVAKPPTKTQKKKEKHPQKAVVPVVPVVPKKETKSIVVTKRKKKKKIPVQVVVTKRKKKKLRPVQVVVTKRKKKKLRPVVPVVRVETVEKKVAPTIVVEKIEAMPMTLRLSVTAADVKKSIEDYRKAIHLRSENKNNKSTKRKHCWKRITCL